ncbi:MAG: translation initiation factor IF-2 [Gemmataceae bacterium]|nr:translation initiation factor IF-2 [Gemmataceae bacterium]
MLKEKVRVYELARELNMQSKDLLDMCRQAGYDVKNQLSSLEPDQRVAIEAMVKKGSKGGTAVAAPPPSGGAPLPNLDAFGKVRTLAPARPKPREAEVVSTPPVAPVPTPPPAAAAPVAPPPAPPSPIPETIPAVTPAAIAPEPVAPPPRTLEPVAAPEPPRPSAPPTAPAKAPDIAASARPPESPPRPPDNAGRMPTLTGHKVPSLNQPKPPDGGGGGSGARPAGRGRQMRPPTIVRHMATPPPLKKLPPKLEPKKQEPIAQKPIQQLPPAVKSGQVSAQDAAKFMQNTPAPPPPDVAGDEELDEDGQKKGAKGRPGHVPGRANRHAARNERATARKAKVETDVRPGRLLTADAGLDDERIRRLKRVKKKEVRRGTVARIGKVPLEIPITVRTLSEATGIKVGELLRKLLGHGAAMTTTINSTLDVTLAELIAAEAGIELEIKRPLDAEDLVLATQDKPSDPESLVARAPVVTVMGHVDHGKTSLLDKIRKSDVVATEAGGITQVIRAWRVEHGGHPITFLDTPGHEAFTKMRARGAQVTDIAVIVCAADDGVMPQTEEAINHARAAKVPIIVAINKVDLPNANLNKTRQQLYGLGLIPDTMGGDTPFVETSAATGKGIPELLDMISLVAETMLVVKADPTKPASGTCLEAMLSEGEGVFATLLIRNGTLHRGDIVLCGSGFGRVRAMYDDLGRPIQEGGPSVPVRITGLDDVPNADDPFVVVPDLATAREISDKRKNKLQEASIEKRAPVTLEKLNEAKIAELKIILKADFRGSVEAIKKELEKLKHAEVRVNVLHTGIGGITESDVGLALTSPDDTIIVGFNVVPDDRARALAEERGVEIREYDIIYNLTDDIRSALEGKLKPHEQVVHLGRAVVREVFKISRVGTVAGCYVTQGNIERSAKVRLIRSGVIIYPPTDRTASLDSLKRFKEDVREVREGYDCGIKIAGYDDVKVDDVIEAYRIEQVQRTL